MAQIGLFIIINIVDIVVQIEAKEREKPRRKNSTKFNMENSNRINIYLYILYIPGNKF